MRQKRICNKADFRARLFSIKIAGKGTKSLELEILQLWARQAVVAEAQNRWNGPYRIREIRQDQGTYPLSELDVAE